MADKRCYYEVLGVARTATDVEITKAYRGLAKKYHPDQNPGDDTVVAKYHEVQEAYEVLRDPQRRQVYDRYGHEGSGAEYVSTGGLFSFPQACRGCGGRGVVIPDPCHACRGVGRVETRESVSLDIPAGVDTRVRLTVPGHGHEGAPGSPRGNLAPTHR